MPQVHELHKFHGPIKLRTIGQDLYRQQKYDEALEAFSAALAVVKEPDLILLDNRSATYEKLDNLQASLKDARQIILLEKSNAKGYLRTGKVLQKMQRCDLALKIYERGLRLVPTKEKDYPLLQAMHKKLLQVVAPPKAVDAFTVLPVEVIEMILYYMGFKQLCRCLRVSKGWHRFLTSWPTLWTSLDFSGATRGVRTSTIYAYLVYAQNNVTRARLRCVELQGNSLLKNIMVRCKRFEDLEILSGGSMGSSLNQAVERSQNLKRVCLGGSSTLLMESVQRILRQCPHLVTAEFHHVMNVNGSRIAFQNASSWAQSDYPNLLNFALCYSGTSLGIFKRGLESFCPPASNLQNLAVGCVTGDWVNFAGIAERYPQLQTLSISNLQDQTVRPHPPARLTLPNRLRCLRLINTNRSIIPRIDSSPQLLGLSELIVKDKYGGEPYLEDLYAFLQQPSTLTPSFETSASSLVKLDVDLNDTSTNPDQIFELVNHSRLIDLEILGLTNCIGVKDDHLQEVAGRLKKLRSLDLSSTRITGVGVKNIVQSLPCLKELRLDDCIDVGADAIAWARGQGPKVLHRISHDGPFAGKTGSSSDFQASFF